MESFNRRTLYWEYRVIIPNSFFFGLYKYKFRRKAAGLKPNSSIYYIHICGCVISAESVVIGNTLFWYKRCWRDLDQCCLHLLEAGGSDLVVDHLDPDKQVLQLLYISIRFLNL